jgi:molybdenum cofactor cytidylyltransferase
MPPEGGVGAAVRTGPIVGILLAGGTSSRMGKNKLLLDLGGESVLRGAARRALDAGVDELIVVLGHQADRARAELDGLDCRTVLNPDYEEGITSSLHTGLGALPPGAGGVMVMLADMPLVSAEMLRQQIDTFRAGTAPLVLSDYEGVHAPPMLYDRSLVPELQAMKGGGCGRKVVKAHAHEADVLRRPSEALTDLDVPEDYERVRGEMA